jgi:hypothetical protein
MEVRLSRRALDELRGFGLFAGRPSVKRRLIPCIGWSIGGEVWEKSTGKTTRLGPGFSLGAISSDNHLGWTLMEQEGVKYAIILPEEAKILDYVEIDYINRKFVVSN